MPKERPILFNGDMVRALLDGRKTQTRRVVKPQPPLGIESDRPGFNALTRRCPYGQPGDRLWVRETWRPSIIHCCGMDACDCDDVGVTYAADGEWRAFTWHSVPPVSDDWSMPKAAEKGNVPSLFMPRWASRITLEIVSVRVERLQDINEEDAKAEGVNGEDEAIAAGLEWFDKPRRAFRFLWQSINGAESWEVNPWVWVVEFKRVEDSQ